MSVKKSTGEIVRWLGGRMSGTSRLLDYGVEERLELRWHSVFSSLGPGRYVVCQGNYRSSHEKNSRNPGLDDVEFEAKKPLNDLKEGTV